MIGLRTIVETVHARSWLRRTDVTLKLVILLSAAVLVVIIDAPLTLAGLLCVVACLYAASGLSGAKLRLVLFITLLTVWGTMFSQALFYASVPRTVLVELIARDTPVLGRLTGGLCVYREGLFYGAVQSMRIVTMIGLGLLLCWTTDPGEFLAALVRLRVPYGVAFMTVTSLRFLPVVVSEAQVVMTARRMKGYTQRRSRWLHPVRSLTGVFKPVFANAIRRSRALALSVESRGFSPAGKRTARRTAPLGAGGLLVCLLFATGLVAVVVMKLLHWMFLEELYYSSGLWWLYDFVRTHL
ncbi:MAG TPA: energy-coupling factor transporter transmembrane component T [Planctomycetota bacterium]|nr:energy-coupling factor transporter transmembrane component T [Planctomycetota bacterium]